MSTSGPGGTVAPTQQRAEGGLQMADEVSQYRAGGRAREETSGWAVGFVLFAAIMMIMAGIFQALDGLVALFNDTFYVTTRNYTFQFDVTAWGWIHLILGIVVALAGWGLLSGRTWARVVGITVAVLSAVANFLWLPYYPFWALTIIALDVFVIWAIAAHGGELRRVGY
jgi:tetrahydromethanopterin S-methyltransferase subunit F